MTSNIQSVLVPRKWGCEKAFNWMEDNNYIIGRVDVTENFYRFRQFEPIAGTKFRIKKLPNDVELVLQIK